MLITVEISH